MIDAELRYRALALYDEFTHVTLDRRRFFADLTRLAGSVAAAQALAAAIAADPAAAAVIMPEDPRIKAQWLTLPGADNGRLKTYLVLPAKSAHPLPAVLVIHENRGLTSYIEDVARRLAIAGFAALAVDFLSEAGGSPADEDKARTMIANLDLQKTVRNGDAAIHWLHDDKRMNGKVGAIGFCWGGALVNRLAISEGNAFDAGVVFYGPSPPPGEAAKVKAAMLLHYAGDDPRVNEGATAWVKALQKDGVNIVRHDYPGTQHAFHNDTAVARYNPEAAALAWDRSILFLGKALAR